MGLVAPSARTPKARCQVLEPLHDLCGNLIGVNEEHVMAVDDDPFESTEAFRQGRTLLLEAVKLVGWVR